MTGPAQLLARRPAHLLLPLGIALAAAAAAAAPSTELLPGPAGTVGTLLAAAVLGAAFAAGYLAPLRALYGLVLVIVLEGAVRKWAVNDITVFLTKDFLALGIYAAVLPRLSLAELRRPWWLLAPLAALVVLAVAHAPLAAAPDQAAVGLRTYLVFVPLLWVGPMLLRTRRAAIGMLVLLVGVGAAQALLATAQVVAGAGILNAVVPGTPVGTNTIAGQGFLRPSGTFLHTGTLSGYLVFVTVAAAALVAVFRRGPLLAVALAGIGFLAVGIVYTSARTLLGSTALVVAALLAYLLLRRRWLSLVAVPVAFLIGIGVVFKAVPLLGPPVKAAIVSLSDPGGVTIEAARRDGGAVEVRIRSDADLERSPGGVSVLGTDTKGTVFEIRFDVASPAGAVLSLGAGEERVLVDPTSARVLRELDQASIAHGAGRLAVATDGARAEVAAGFLGRAADISKGGGRVGIWEERVRPNLVLVADQRLIGQGTGTMTPGARYSSVETTVLGESSFVRVAWELGLPGLLVFLWLLVALAVASALGVRRARAPWERAVAVTALGAALVLPLWLLVTYTFEIPVVQALYFLLAGAGAAFASRPAQPPPPAVRPGRAAAGRRGGDEAATRARPASP
jgi:hypothetical protein